MSIRSIEEVRSVLASHAAELEIVANRAVEGVAGGRGMFMGDAPKNRSRVIAVIRARLSALVDHGELHRDEFDQIDVQLGERLAGGRVGVEMTYLAVRL